MPSFMIDKVFSGGTPLFSGNAFSGFRPTPQSEIYLRASKSNSGNVYVGLSGGVTITSGGFPLSGGNTTDGIELAPGDSIRLPVLAVCPPVKSGGPLLWFDCDAITSGRARVFYECF